MSKGFVYVASIPTTPGMVKVGWTKRMPEERVKEEEGTFHPTSIKIETAFLFPSNAFGVEQKAHELMADIRLPGKEWFECDPHYAREKILEAAALIDEPVRGEDPILPPKADIEEDSGEDFKRAPDDQKTVQVSCDCGRTFPAPAHPSYPSHSLCPNCHSDWTVFADPENPGAFVIQSHSSAAAQEEEAKRQLQEEGEHRKRKSSYKKKSTFGEHPVLPPKAGLTLRTNDGVTLKASPHDPVLPPKADIEEEHQRREAATLAAARKEYDREMKGPSLVDHDGPFAPSMASNRPHQSFEEWNSPGERAKRERGKTVTEILKKNLEERQATEDPFLTKKGCLLMFLGILGLITTVPLLLSKITLF